MEKIKIVSVNISEKKGTVKKPVKSIKITLDGIDGDAHAGAWHRQISLLGTESMQKFKTTSGRDVTFGEFAENITTEGYPVYQMKPLDRLISGNVILEVTQIGKKCHGEKCNIFKETGDCVMPKEGIFARVLKGGILKAGDDLEYHKRIIRSKIITLSDRASKGIYEDKSGPLLQQLVQDFLTTNGRVGDTEVVVIPDEPLQLKELIKKYASQDVDLIFTTGGTGIGPRDITTDVIKPLLDKEIPGIMEFIRLKYGTQFPNALISRSVAGVIGKSLIYALPGNPKAVKEYSEEIFKTVEHSLRMLNNIDFH